MAAGLMLAIPLTAQTIQNVDEIAPFSEGLAAVRKGNQWGFINESGTLVIDFRDDLVWNEDADVSRPDVSGIQHPIFNEGRCLITKKVEDGVSVYGFIDKTGKVVLEPMLLNVYPFKDGYTTGVLFEKTLRGKNEFKFNIYEFKFFDVMLDTSGEIVEYFNRRYGIQMTRRRYTLPWIGVKMLNDQLVAVYEKDQGWEIRALDANN